jgi:transposase IS66 family protein
VYPDKSCDRKTVGESFAGVVNCDRAKMYWLLPKLQWCWAHLKRDFQALIDTGDQQAKRLGRELLPSVRELFRLWARYRDGTLTRSGWLRLMRPIRVKVDALLLRGAYSRNKRLVGKALPPQRRQFAFRHVQPTGVFGGGPRCLIRSYSYCIFATGSALQITLTSLLIWALIERHSLPRIIVIPSVR